MTLPAEGHPPTVRDDGAILAAWSLALNTLMTLAKYLLYLLTGSAALLAETVHSLTDVVGTLLVLGGILLAGRKSPQFPWGLYKAENLAALFSAMLIFVSAYEIGQAIVLHRPPAMKHLEGSAVILLCLAVPIILFSRHEKRKALELKSPSLLADAENWRTDLAPLAIVIAGLVGTRLSYAYFDRIAAFAILLLVIRAGYGIARDAIRSLLDSSVDRKTLDAMKQVLEGFAQVTEVASLQARNSGRYIFAEAAVRLSLQRLKEAHDVADCIERTVRQQFPAVEKMTVHYEPATKGFTRYAAMLHSRDGTLSAHFGAAPLVALWDRDESQGVVLSRDIVGNPFTGLDKGKGIRLAEFLAGQQVDILYAKEDFSGKGPAYVFADAGIEIRSTEAAILGELMESAKIRTARG
jgi:cation diffusion facilitator family transporter